MPAVAALAATALGWAVAPIFIRAFRDVYDPYSQTVLRYGSAAAPLLVISLIQHRRDTAKAFVSGHILGISLLNVVLQAMWVVACYLTTATLAQLLSKLSTVFIIALSFLLFHEERAVIRSPFYLVGTALSFAGMMLVLCKDGMGALPALDTATLLMIGVAVLWAGYAVWGKHAVAQIHPVPMFTAVAVYSTLGFVILMVWLGDPHTLIKASSTATLLAVLSGLVSIALAHTCFFYAEHHLGAALCNSLILLNPLITNAIGLFLWADERLVPVQWAGAALLLAGTWMVTAIGRRSRQASEPVEAAEPNTPGA